LPTIYLASSSPRRRDLLNQINLPHIVIATDVDESLPGEMPPAEQVMELSRRKARAAARQLAVGVIIAADTVVVLNNEVLGKPENEADALAILERLQGATHEVYTGLTVLELPGERVLTDFERTTVKMREADRAELMRYVQSGEPLDKAGAYGIQGLASVFVEGIRGCYFNVVGLPITRLVLMLKKMDIDVSAYWR